MSLVALCRTRNGPTTTTSASAPSMSRASRPLRCRHSRAMTCSALGASTGGATTAACSVIANPWVDVGVQEIGGEIDQDQRHREHEDDALDGREVARADGLDQKP